jgi:type I restriction enzyme S subunit
MSAEYLYYFLSRETFRAEGVQTMGGAVGHQRVAKEFIENYPVPLPPLPEQQRIVAILDEAFEGLAAASANAEKNLKNACELFDGYRDLIFARKNDGWRESPLNALVEIKHGFAFSGQYFTDRGDYVVLTPGNFFEEGGYRDRGDKQKYYVGDIPKGYILREGDFLIAMTEQAPGLLGSSIIVPESNKFLHNQRLGLVCVKRGGPWCSGFFFHAFNTRNFRQAVHDGAAGVKVRHTSPGKLGVVHVSYPRTVSEQEEIAAALDEIHDESKRLAALCRQKIDYIAELKQSLLAKAFAGELI